MTSEPRQNGTDRRHVGAGRVHTARQGDRPRRHRSGQPSVSRDGVLANPDGIAMARLPAQFGNWNSLFKRFRRWALSGVIERVFNVLSDEFDFEYVFVDGTIVSTHQKASGAKGDLPPGHRPFPRRSEQQDRRGCGRAWLPCAVHDPSWSGARPCGGCRNFWRIFRSRT